MIELETRTFEQRFGTRCPFCNEPWSSEKRCGEREPGDYTIQDSLRLLFAGNRAADCALCARAIPSGRTYCADCSEIRARRHGNRHRRLTKNCEWCAQPFQTQKKEGRYCSVAHSNMARARRGQEEQAA